MTRSRRPPSPISSGTWLSDGPPPARRSTERSASSREPVRAEPSSCWPTRCSSSSAAGRGRRRSLSSARAERQRPQLETALSALGVPYAIEGRIGSARRRSARPCLALLRRVARRGAPRLVRLPALTVLRSRPGACGLPRRTPSRPRRERPDQSRRGDALLGAAAADARHLRAAAEPLEAVRARPLDDPCRVRARRPPVGEDAALDLRAHRAVTDLVAELEEWLGLGRALPRGALRRVERATLRIARGDEPGRVAVTDLLRARTRRTEIVFLLGLEEGSFPRRQQGTPFLDEEERRSIDEASRNARLAKPNQVSRERYFFYTACTRPRAACTSSARPRRTTAHRGSRARSGTRHKPSSTRTTSSAGRLAGVWRS